MKSDTSEVERVLAERLSLVQTDEQGNPSAGGSRLYAALGPVPLPVSLLTGATATFQWTTFARVDDETLRLLEGVTPSPHNARVLLRHLSRAREWPQSVLTYGDFAAAAQPLVRIHSNCATGDVFGSQRCECGPQLRSAMLEISTDGAGALIYMADHEGRGIGLFAKAAAYLLQDRGFDTYQANLALGFEEDDRDFSDAAFILKHLRGTQRAVRLLSNNPEKSRALTSVGIPVEEMVPLVTGVTRNNVRYLSTKRAYGHILPEDLLNLDLSALSCEAS